MSAPHPTTTSKPSLHMALCFAFEFCFLFPSFLCTALSSVPPMNPFFTSQRISLKIAHIASSSPHHGSLTLSVCPQRIRPDPLTGLVWMRSRCVAAFLPSMADQVERCVHFSLNIPYTRVVRGRDLGSLMGMKSVGGHADSCHAQLICLSVLLLLRTVLSLLLFQSLLLRTVLSFLLESIPSPRINEGFSGLRTSPRLAVFNESQRAQLDPSPALSARVRDV